LNHSHADFRLRDGGIEESINQPLAPLSAPRPCLGRARSLHVAIATPPLDPTAGACDICRGRHAHPGDYRSETTANCAGIQPWPRLQSYLERSIGSRYETPAGSVGELPSIMFKVRPRMPPCYSTLALWLWWWGWVEPTEPDHQSDTTRGIGRRGYKFDTDDDTQCDAA